MATDRHDNCAACAAADLLRQLLTVPGVEPTREYVWGKDELPARIRIPADLAHQVFGGSPDAD